jgi:hypothetical protein
MSTARSTAAVSSISEAHELKRPTPIRIRDVFADSPAWPEAPPLDNYPYYGLAGKIVRTIEPWCEGAPIAILAQTLAAFGNVVGRGPHAKVGATDHHMNLFVAIVGDTAVSRKGTSWNPVKRIFEEVDPRWGSQCIQSGLSSGEGLIHALRDPVEGAPNDAEAAVDPGVQDKRQFVIEGEFATVLTVLRRQGNTLSQYLRKAWDGDTMQTLTKRQPEKATGAHISIVGHVTKDELLSKLGLEAKNGFGNRFLWLAAKRSKSLPNPGQVPSDKLQSLADQLAEAIEFSRSIGELRRSEKAAELWDTLYRDLDDRRANLEPGIDALVARDHGQLLRLSCIYALMARSEIVKTQHLQAAMALWSYAEASTNHIFWTPPMLRRFR